MLTTFNDEDIIQEVIEHILSQGLELIILENGSTDNTYDTCKKFLSQGILKIYQYQSEYFDIEQNLRILYDIALTFNPEWMGRMDSDEFHETGLENTTLKDVIIQADKQGYNLIQSHWFEFFLTNKDDESKKSIKEKLKYYSSQGDFQYRFWKYIPGIFFGSHGFHLPIFPLGQNYKIYPKKMILRHYPFRSVEHAKRKTTLKLRGRSLDGNDTPLIDAHERQILRQDFSAKVDCNLLSEYKEDGVWDYQEKYNPFNFRKPIKKEDIFTEDGKLRKREMSFKECRGLLRRRDNIIQNLNEKLKKHKNL